MIQECGPIQSVNFLRPAIFDLRIELPGLAKQSRAGQFVHLLIQGVPTVLLRRPLSIAGAKDGLIRFLVRVVGEGTAALSRMSVGTVMDAIGPLGNPFKANEVKRALLVGGGIGDAPLLFLQDEFHHHGIPTVFFLGARTAEEFPLTESEIAKRSIRAATDDGSFGAAGFVSVQLEKWLKENDLTGVKVFSCGPLLMMTEVDRLCRQYNLPHQVSLENRMGCGIGVCQGCAVRINSDQSDPRGGYRLVCKDGPVFDAKEIEWALI